MTNTCQNCKYYYNEDYELEKCLHPSTHKWDYISNKPRGVVHPLVVRGVESHCDKWEKTESFFDWLKKKVCR